MLWITLAGDVAAETRKNLERKKFPIAPDGRLVIHSDSDDAEQDSYAGVLQYIF